MTNYWCCKADFGEHESTCPNYRAPSEPKVVPLTQAEVDALTDGTLVEVVWSGGNGPHIYQLTHERGQTLVGPLPGKTGIKHSIKFVGETPPFTVIRMATPKPVIRQAIMPLSEPMICTRCK